LNRFRLGVAFKPVDWLKIYAQGQDSREWFSDRPNIPGALGAEGDDTFDLRQGYIQLGPKWVNATVGRQTLAYGDERLIGISDWNNFGRTFDAVKMHYEKGKFSLDLLAPRSCTSSAIRSTSRICSTGAKRIAIRFSVRSTPARLRLIL
jgi:hypothetical protein